VVNVMWDGDIGKSEMSEIITVRLKFGGKDNDFLFNPNKLLEIFGRDFVNSIVKIDFSLFRCLIWII
jgi:hypothetical protein